MLRNIIGPMLDARKWPNLALFLGPFLPAEERQMKTKAGKKIGLIFDSKKAKIGRPVWARKELTFDCETGVVKRAPFCCTSLKLDQNRVVHKQEATQIKDNKTKQSKKQLGFWKGDGFNLGSYCAIEKRKWRKQLKQGRREKGTEGNQFLEKGML